MEYHLGQKVKMKFCCKKCKSNDWMIIRVGCDIKIKCLRCENVLMLSIGDFNIKTKMDDELKDTISYKDIENYNNTSILNTKIGDIVSLKEEYKNYEIIGDNNRDLHCWKVVSIESGVVLQNLETKQLLRFDYDEYIKKIQVNITRSYRIRQNNKKENKRLRILQKQAIEQDIKLQYEKYGRKLKCDDIVVMKKDMECPYCGKRFYKIISISDILNKPVVIHCATCNELKNTIYDNEMNEIKDDFNNLSLVDRASNKRYTRDNNYKKRIICPKCGSGNAMLVKKTIYPQARYKVICSDCQKSKSIELNRNIFFEKIEEANELLVLERKNSTFESFDGDRIRLAKDKNLYSSSIQCLINEGIILQLQLIDSAYNHVSAMHKIENREVKIAYKENENTKIFYYKCHYCKTCGKYFDFKTSFESQLKEKNIEVNSLLLNLSKVSNDNLASFNYCVFNGETLLHSFGYIVGLNGSSQKQRRKLLDDVNEQGLMSISEMKLTINNNIKRFKDRDGYEIAVAEWEDDLAYLNKKI